MGDIQDRFGRGGVESSRCTAHRGRRGRGRSQALRNRDSFRTCAGRSQSRWWLHAIEVQRSRAVTTTNEPSDGVGPTIPIEWNYDMDSIRLSIPALDDVTEFTLRTRCQRCWGPARGRTDPEHRVTGIKCFTLRPVPGRRICWGRRTPHLKGIVRECCQQRLGHTGQVWRWPILAKGLSEDRPAILSRKVLSQVALAKGRYPKSPRKRLTRHEFPADTPGWFFLQARVLMDGVSRATDHERDSIANFPNYEVNDDGSVSVSIDLDGLSPDPPKKRARAATVGCSAVAGIMD